MEAFTQKWAIISLLEQVEDGTEFHYTDSPLHVTFAGVFAAPVDGNKLVAGLVNILAEQKSVEIQADKMDMFGPNKDIPVMKIKKGAALMALYGVIYMWLDKSEVKYNSPEYQGKGYQPHSTFQKTGSLRPGEKRLLKTVSLIDMYPHSDGYQRRIFKTVDLL